ncbi:hypothetical protein GGR42_002109 [Saonia flava]|uniref:Uncharacterized protein n=1 Tax=Saonia flava TaxID=523696 RepID=A0A846QWN7_9FLAO|nr:hypothetical protein [Saonia flava]NJB71647.1 hypothetical protein [Saonia flava]
MKKLILVLGLLPMLILTGCLGDDPALENDFEDDVLALQASLDLVNATAGQSVCADGFTCKFIALGAKACGGPKSYLVYSTSIDTDNLEAMVAAYNQKEKEFNTKWDIVSDCALVVAPTGTTCENGKCVAVYDN